MKLTARIFKYFRLNIATTSAVDEPNTLRTAISRRRYSLSNTTSPNTPIMLMAMASSEKTEI